MEAEPASGEHRSRADFLPLILFLVALAHRSLIAAWTSTVASDGVFSLWAAQAGVRGDWNRLLESYYGMHPLFSILVALITRAGVGLNVAAYAVACITSSASVVPLFYFVRTAWNRRVAAGACVLYALHPMLALASSEATNLGLYLGLMITALALFDAGLRGRVWTYPLGGAAAALGYLTRPEGISLGVYFMAAGIHALIVNHFAPTSPVPPRARLWARFRQGVGLLACAACFVAVAWPYVSWIHGATGRWAISRRASAGFLVDKLLGRTPSTVPLVAETSAEESESLTSAPTSGSEALPGPASSSSPLPMAKPSEHRKAVDRGLPVTAGKMFVRAFYWPLIPFGLLGVRFLRAQGGTPLRTILFDLMAVMAALPPLLLYFGTKGTYAISPRYFMVSVILLLPWCAAGILEVGDLVSSYGVKLGRPSLLRRMPVLLGAILVAVLLVKSVGPRRPRERAFLEAGSWVSGQAAGFPISVACIRPKLAYYAGARFVSLPLPAPGEEPVPYLDRLMSNLKDQHVSFLILVDNDLRYFAPDFFSRAEIRGIRTVARFPNPAADRRDLESVWVFRWR